MEVSFGSVIWHHVTYLVTYSYEKNVVYLRREYKFRFYEIKADKNDRASTLEIWKIETARIYNDAALSSLSSTNDAYIKTE